MTVCDACGGEAGAMTTTVMVGDKNVPLNFCAEAECRNLSDAALETLAIKHRDRRRYRSERSLINWTGDDRLKVLKMLAWQIWKHERPGAALLWKRVEVAYPRIANAVLHTEVRFKDLCTEVQAKFGTPLTPAKLMQRADKTERYGELNEFADKVGLAYRRLGRTAA